MLGKYYDGQSSKPHTVEVRTQASGIKIVGRNSAINRFWPYTEISSESFATGDKVLLSYGTFPHERLELNGPGARPILSLVGEQESRVKSIYHVITQTGSVQLVLGGLATLGLVLYMYIVHLSPWIGERAVALLPTSIEVRAGQVMYNNMDLLVDKDADKSLLLEQFYEACRFNSAYDIRIDYATQDVVNAFAIPGGQIVIYEGLIESTESWDELAALIAHELAHVNQRHSFKQIARSVSSYFLFAVLTGDVAGTSSVVLDNATQIYQLSNSRAHETEADLVGLSYLKAARIRPAAMLDLLARIRSETRRIESEIEDKTSYKVDIEASMEYFQTHPATSSRMKKIQSTIENDTAYSYVPDTNEKARLLWEELKASID